MLSIKKQLEPKSFKEIEIHKSAGILDDFAIRKDIQTRTITAENIINNQFVPYTGATSDVDLGSNGLTTTGNIRSDGGFSFNKLPNTRTAMSASLTSGFISSATGFHLTLTGSGDYANCYGFQNNFNISGAGASGYGYYNAVSSSGVNTNQSIYGVANIMNPHSPGVTNYGEFIQSQNTTLNNPSVNQIGLYIDWKNEGTDSNMKRWAIYNAGTLNTASKVFLGKDNVKTYWGTGNDLEIYHDGTNSIIKNNTGQLSIDTTDMVFTTSGSGLPYGSCWGNEIAWTQASAAQNTWYNISDADMTDGQLNLVTHDGSGKLTIAKAGRYLINYSASCESSDPNIHLEVGIEITGSGSAINDGRQHVITFTANEQYALSSTAIISLAANDTIEIAVRTTDTGTPNLSVDHLNITIIQIGG